MLRDWEGRQPCGRGAPVVHLLRSYEAGMADQPDRPGGPADEGQAGHRGRLQRLWFDTSPRAMWQSVFGDHKDQFTYDEQIDSFTCPQGQTLAFVRIQHANGVPLRLYRASGAVCQACPAFRVCTKAKEIGRTTSPSRLDVHLSS